MSFQMRKEEKQERKRKAKSVLRNKAETSKEGKKSKIREKGKINYTPVFLSTNYSFT